MLIRYIDVSGLLTRFRGNNNRETSVQIQTNARCCETVDAPFIFDPVYLLLIYLEVVFYKRASCH